MSIRVTCTKCHTRFNVSEKFAGKEGPCPKCKTKIRVPMPAEEIRIEAPKTKGPTDTKGRAIVDPILRKDTVLSSVQIVMLVAGLVGFLALAFGMRFAELKPEDTIWWSLLGLGGLLLAIPLNFVSYHIIRDNDLEPFSGFELWKRIAICGAVFAITWISLPAAAYAFNGQYFIGSWALASVAMFAAGTVASMGSFEFEWFLGAVHYGLYFAVAIIGRGLAGLAWLPQSEPLIPGPNPWATSMIESAQAITDVFAIWFY